MSVFNRIVALLLLAGIFLAGFFGVIYCFGVLGYDLAQLDSPLTNTVGSVQTFVTAAEEGRLSSAGLTLLVVVALIGLVLLIFELKRSRPRRVRLRERSTFATRAVVKGQAESFAAEKFEVLSSKAKVTARRKPGAKITLRTDVRQGSDANSLQRQLRDLVQERLASKGMPASRLSVKTIAADPRGSDRRVG